MGATAIDLNIDNACTYLSATGHIPEATPCQARAMGGGVSGEVILVEAGPLRWVLKQARARLRVAADWVADPARTAVEARALALLATVLPAGSVPDLVFYDAVNRVLAMTALPKSAQNLKTMLLAGTIPSTTIRACGRLLGQLQSETQRRSDVREAFHERALFRQLRIEPYYETAAARHAGLVAAITAQAAFAMDQTACLVHGDFSPKNILVAEGRPVLLDYEVSHWGCRAFDPAFFLTHLTLKALHLPHYAVAFNRVAKAFWNAYRSSSGWPDLVPLEQEVMGQLGCLLLARVDGKSPVEYIQDDSTRAQVRQLASDILEGRRSGLSDVWEATTP